MARLPRGVLPGHPHLVVQRALAGVAAFADRQDRQAALDTLREGLATERVQLHAYALTTAELRLVLTPPSAQALSRLMQHLGRRYVAGFNRRHGRQGTLWDGRFGCAVLQEGAACLDALLWVDAASDEAGATSADHHLGRQHNPLLSDPPSWWALGNTPFERELAYRQRLAEGLPAQRAQALTAALRSGWVVGDEAFAALASSTTGRPARPRPRGRPPRRPPGSPTV